MTVAIVLLVVAMALIVAREARAYRRNRRLPVDDPSTRAAVMEAGGSHLSRKEN